MKPEHSIILGIDTSCDDTCAAVVQDGRTILSNIVSGQDEIHDQYGGIVPELASRRHIEIISQVVWEALEKSRIKAEELSAIAVCHGPGLIGSLIVGANFAKSFSYTLRKPLLGVNHLEGHIFGAFLTDNPPRFPFLALIVSGGHTSIYRVDQFKEYRELGRTRDDAAGEAYDKVAKMLGLGYPGGPVIDRLASIGNEKAVDFPRAYMADTFDFSFSGLKTSVRNYLYKNGWQGDGVDLQIPKEDICASFQVAVIDVLIKKTKRAAQTEDINRLVLSGGVAANSELRTRMIDLAEEEDFEIFIPPKELCTDNAAMIAAAGHCYYENELFADTDLNPKAYMPLGS